MGLNVEATCVEQLEAEAAPVCLGAARCYGQGKWQNEVGSLTPSFT